MRNTKLTTAEPKIVLSTVVISVKSIEPILGEVQMDENLK